MSMTPGCFFQLSLPVRPSFAARSIDQTDRSTCSLPLRRPSTTARVSVDSLVHSSCPAAWTRPRIVRARMAGVPWMMSMERSDAICFEADLAAGEDRGGDLLRLPLHGCGDEAGLGEGHGDEVDLLDVERPSGRSRLDVRRSGVGGGLDGGHVAVLAHVELGHDASW
jgi:hypothetical protein